MVSRLNSALENTGMNSHYLGKVENMTNEEKREYIRVYSEIAARRDLLINRSIDTYKKVVEEYKPHFNMVPKKLYKYRKFKDHNIDSIRNRTLYLSYANKLDDCFEASVKGVNSRDYFESEYNKPESFLYYVENVLKAFDVYSEDAVQMLQENPFFDKESKGFYYITKYLVEDRNISLENVKHILGLLGFYRNDEFKNQFFIVMEYLLQNQSNTGICSLTTNNKSQIMWEYYADQYKGFCIEYSIDDDDYLNLIDLVPVIYSESRTIEATRMAIEHLTDQMFYDVDNQMKKFTRNLFGICTIKHPEWSFQDEWRIIGYPGFSNNPAPRISAIYLGRDVSEQNKNTMIGLSNDLGIPLYQLEYDMCSTCIKYEKI